MIYHANCLDVLEAMGDNTLDALVTDPPYGLGFMGRAWDKALPDPRIWRECLRAMKPGAHGVIFGAPRLYHRLACQVEDAGFEVRDVLMWMFGSGFPKSHDPSKAVGITSRDGLARDLPQSEEARRLLGLGTALKPAYEPILLVRKPLRGTVAENVLAYGTGCLNIGACRVGSDSTRTTHTAEIGYGGGNLARSYITGSDAGRWPANVVLDEEAGALLDEQSGTTKSSDRVRNNGAFKSVAKGAQAACTSHGFSDSGGASRFFKSAGFDTEEWIIHRAKAMLHGWNPDLASTADDSSTLPRAFVDSALNDVAIWAALGVTLSVEWTGHTTNVTPSESRRIVETAITTTLSIAQGCSLAWLLGRHFQNSSHVSHAERCEQTGTMRITVSHWKSNGSADPVTFSITPMTSGLGEAVSGSRAYYCAKASKAEREAGLDHLDTRTVTDGRAVTNDTAYQRGATERRNTHPTVKPIALMRYLVRLIAPNGGTVFDPFTGSGSTGVACALEDVAFVGAELEAEYVKIANARVEHALGLFRGDL